MKMKSTILLVALTASAALGQDRPEPPAAPPAPPIPPVMKVLDTNKDGVLSAQEIAAASDSLAQLDADQNGRISEEETRPPKPEGEKEGRRQPRGGEEERPAPPVMAALDQNGDGTLSKREVGRASKSLNELDVDGSGSLEREEMTPVAPEEGGPQGGGGPGGPRPPHPPRGGGR